MIPQGIASRERSIGSLRTNCQPSGRHRRDTAVYVSLSSRTSPRSNGSRLSRRGAPAVRARVLGRWSSRAC